MCLTIVTIMKKLLPFLILLSFNRSVCDSQSFGNKSDTNDSKVLSEISSKSQIVTEDHRLEFRENILLTNSSENNNATTLPCRCMEISLCNQTEHPAEKVSNNQTEQPEQVSNNTGSDIAGIVDFRININQCHNASEVCCGASVSAAPQNNVSLSVPTVTQTSVSWKPKRCGQFNEGEKRFRWLVSVAVERGGSGVTFLCYGSLIHPSVVLTTANCVFQIANSGIGSTKTLRVILQNANTNGSKPELLQPSYYVVKEVLFHDKLYRKRYEFDLALLILEREIPLSSEVDTVCLPPLEIDQAYFENMICTSTMEGDGSGTDSNKVEMFLLTKQQCEEKLLKSSSRQPPFHLHESLLCAEVNNPADLMQSTNGTCAIGTAAPLLCRHGPSRYFIQVGVASWNLNICDSKVHPIVFVNLPFVVSWVRMKMRSRHFDSKYFELVDDDLMMRIELLKT